MTVFDPSLTWYVQALSGRARELVPYASDADPWQHPDTATTIRLPRKASADWYRVALTHRALHDLLGTFELALDRAEPLFPRLRPAGTALPPLERFIRLFGRTALAVEVFAVLEDLRVDAALGRMFRGLVSTFDAARADALRDRPTIGELPARSAVAEALVRLSLGHTPAVPDRLREPWARVAAVASALRLPAATVESTAEATIRVYDVLAGLPNAGLHTPEGSWDDTTAAARLGAAEVRLEGDELLDVRFAAVAYRDAPGPRYLGQHSSGMPLQELILRMTDEATHGDGFAALSVAAERGDVDVTTPPEPLPHDHGPDLDGHHHDVAGSLHAHGRDEYLYPEWDHVAGSYLPSWCLLRERRPSTRHRRRATSPARGLLPGLVTQLERVHPAGRDLVRRLSDGDDLDFDACLEALIDLRAGIRPGDRVYTGLVDRRRDVAVALAIDLSSSTAERLPSTADGPVTRIIDLQRDAAVLLVAALERVGDAYGVYGFSGTGRADVRLSVVKDLDERRTPATAHRLAGLAPDHTTRMGPAIRHLAARLARHEARTRILLIVSDGRPFDVDYGQRYGEDAVLDYAVADTARALTEARRQGVHPYLVTVDPDGGDYLGDLCTPEEYHVIKDARQLPGALAELYAVARSAAGRGVRERRR